MFIIIIIIINYRPLDNPMVGTRAKKVHRLIQSLLQEGYIDDMTAKWLSLTPDPPRIPVFYTLTKIHKPTLIGRPVIYQGVTAVQKESQLLLTTSFSQ